MGDYQFERTYFYNFIVLILLIVITGVFILFTSSVIIDICSLIFLVFSSIIVIKFDIMHPYTWYLPFFLLYSISQPLLVILGWSIYNEEIMNSALIMQWVAMSVFIIVITPKKRKYNLNKYNEKIRKAHNLIPITKIVYTISLIMISFYLISIIGSGAKVKVDITQGVASNNLNSFASLAYMSFGLLYSYELIKNNKIPKMLTIITVAWTLVTFLISGERDILLKFIWCISLLYFLVQSISKYKIVIMGFLGVSIIPILQNFKNFGLTGETRGFSSSSFIIDFLRSEFNSAGDNLNLVISNFNWDNFLLGRSLIWDFKRVFFYMGESTTQWFNETFYLDSVHGQGFTIVGEGYVNLGVIGVIIWFLIISFIVRVLYLNSTLNIIWLNIYILSMPMFIYVTRADFANLLSGVFKQIILPLVVLYLVKIILERRRGFYKYSRVLEE
ncbi:oligosaccharide repeat unit polymerase [Halobacillus salinarum]|uniref:Oligosaccharide repeat unit polymerase n=1 Tax=Halobacillus salinarum TaxID=2932257 RepID=A0ABY4EMU9_9BACI|nr:O-antigen polymerase [Halobacillus salinarum]UOQ45391.1 oligosaccharide repeat unit polymerase [Halobacillus salinarum]